MRPNFAAFFGVTTWPLAWVNAPPLAGAAIEPRFSEPLRTSLFTVRTSRAMFVGCSCYGIREAGPASLGRVLRLVGGTDYFVGSGAPGLVSCGAAPAVPAPPSCCEELPELPL